MKLLLLSDINSTHTQKWVLGLATLGVEVYVFSFNRATYQWFKDVPNVTVVYQAEEQISGRSTLEKLKYVFVLGKLKNVIRRIKPDIVHAHYASSYGLLGALSGFHPLIVSVWGSDVYDFPKKSPLHEQILRRNLRMADHIFSTSRIMRDETRKYTNKHIEVTPFGVDTEVFKPMKVDSIFPKNTLVVGVVKALEAKYGTTHLIRAFAEVRRMRPEFQLRLLLVGGGSMEADLKNLVEGLGIGKDVVFTGPIPFDKVPVYHCMIDIFVSVSTDDSESFGVSAVESCASGKAVIVSRIGGLKEVIVENETGIIVESGDIKGIANAILHFVDSSEERAAFGERARAHVIETYNWKDNLHAMHGLFKGYIAREGGDSR
ncbi:MAG: glycosyltransferase [Cyclobacteriaceae bacterium]